MTNEGLKKKIVGILEESQTPVEYDDGDWGQTYFPTNEDVADALIAAGVGDISAWKHRAEVAERALRNLAQLCAKGAKYYLQSDKAVKERERELYDEWINNAEKELAEEKKG